MSDETPLQDARRPRVLEGIAGLLITLAFCVALVAFGGRSLAWVVTLSAILAAVSALLLALARADAPGASRLRVVAAGLLIAIPALSLIPLPEALVQIASPRRAEIVASVPRADGGLDRWLVAGEGRALTVREVLDGAGTVEAASAAATATDVGAGSQPLSFDSPATASALATLAAFLALILALSRGCERTGLRVLLITGIVTSAMSAHAIAWDHLGNGKIYGLFAAPPNVGQQPFGPFWNPNHFAALLALMGILGLAAALSSDLEARVRIVAAVASIPLWAGVLAAGSRGGLLGAGCGLVALGVLLALAPGRRRRIGGAILAATLVGLVLCVAVFPERVLDQTLETATRMEGSNFERARIYRAELRMVQASPVLGVGLGAFRTAYPAFQDEPDPLAPLHGESDWLESLAEGGLPLALAWCLLIGALLTRPLRALRRPDAPVFLAGLVAATVGVLAHAAVDFHLREPSVAIAALVAAATACAWASRLDRVSPRAAGGARSVSLLLGAAALVALAVIGPRWIAWDAAARAGERAFVEGQHAEALESARQATLAWPERASAWALLAACEEQLAKAAMPADRAGHRQRALGAAVEALRRDPLALGAARVAGQALLAAGADREALEAAELAVAAAPGHASAHRLLGQVLLRAGRPDEALPHLAFAFDAMPFEQISQQARVLARMVHEAAQGDAARTLAVMTSRGARIYYIHRLQADGHGDEIGAHLAIVQREGVLPSEADEWSYGLIGGSAEAARLARELLPSVTLPVARLRIAKALLAAGDPEGRALLERVVSEPSAPADAFATLAMALVKEERHEDARAVIEAGLVAHPTDAVLLKLRAR